MRVVWCLLIGCVGVVAVGETDQVPLSVHSSFAHVSNVRDGKTGENKSDIQISKIVHPVNGPTGVNPLQARARHVITEGGRAMRNSCPSRCNCINGNKTVYCNGRQLDHIPTDIPLGVTKLYLQDNHISRVEKTSLSSYTNLTLLYLNDNQLLKIEDGAFDGLSKLTTLFLRNNLLGSTKNLTEATLRGLSGLKRIYLTENKLKQVPHLPNSTLLTKLLLDNNQIANVKFPSSYKALTNLAQITININPIKTLKKDAFQVFNHSTRLAALKISRCELKYVEPGTFSVIPNLQALSLSYNEIPAPQLKHIIQGLGHMRHLASLDLSNVITGEQLPNDTFAALSGSALTTLTLEHNTISVIQKGTFAPMSKLAKLNLASSKIFNAESGAFDGLPQLERLDLRKNSLTTLPKVPTSLIELDLSGNRLDRLHSYQFRDLTQLKNLSLQDNMIHTIDSNAFVGLGDVIQLDLSDNKIGGSNFPSNTFNPLFKLLVLKLQNNEMSVITDKNQFKSLSNLTYLDLSGNDCRELPLSVFQPLKSLSTLNLRENLLCDVIARDGIGLLFKGNPLLQEIFLENNQLSSLPGPLLHNQRNLRSAHFQGNRIIHWGIDFFQNLDHLRLANLSDNRISLINDTNVAHLRSFTALDLTRNTLSCDCDTRWFRRWVNSTHVHLPGVEEWKCATPKGMQGQSFLSFNPDDRDLVFRCNTRNVVIIASVSAAIFILVVGSVCFACRYKIYFCKYKCRKHFCGKRDGRRGEYARLIDIRYDLFLSHAVDHQTMTWVMEQFMPKMDNGDILRQNNYQVPEDLRGPFKVCFDDTPGMDGFEATEKAIQESKKVILLLNKAYFNDRKRKDYDLCVIIDLHRPSTIIPVLLEPEVMIGLPGALRKRVIEELIWKEDDDMAQEVFWARIKEEVDRVIPREDPQV